MSSNTQQQILPRHVAIIMDGNGRWAKARHLPRIAGHRAGVEAVRKVVEGCAKRGIEALTLFAFSSENWRRPQQEVGMLMELFMLALERETRDLHKNKIRLSVIGDRSMFSPKLQKAMADAEALTRDNTGLRLTVAANYGGRWDIVQAVKVLVGEVADGKRGIDSIDEAALADHLVTRDLPEPDLFIRTGGEQRISNFLLWNLAYTELYFTPLAWPEFDDAALEAALQSFASRERRFGQTSEQVRSRV